MKIAGASQIAFVIWKACSSVAHGELRNEMGGSTYGAGWAGPHSAGYFALLTGRVDGLLVARRTIRQLAAEPESVDREMTLHGARMHALHECGMTGRPVDDQAIMAALEEHSATPASAMTRPDTSTLLVRVTSSSMRPIRSGLEVPRGLRDRPAG